jgi:hypothetical protein
MIDIVASEELDIDNAGDLLRIEVKAGSGLLKLNDIQSFMRNLQTALDEVAQDLSKTQEHGVSYEIAEAHVGSFALTLKAVGSEFVKVNPPECLSVFSSDIKNIPQQKFRPGISSQLLRSYTSLARTLNSINATIQIQYQDSITVIDKQFRENVRNTWKERISDNITVTGNLDAVNAHSGQYMFHLYPKLEHVGRVDCVFNRDMLSDIAELLKRKQLVKVTGRGHFGPVGMYPFKIEIDSLPTELSVNGPRLRSYVNGLEIVPKNLSASEYLQRNREAMGFIE